jgi:hypothetical protein
VSLELCDGWEYKALTTCIALSYRNSKLEKEREKEEVCGRYLSTLAWSRLY